MSAMEESLNAQLRAVRSLRKGQAPGGYSVPRRGPSQVDTACEILKTSYSALHVNELPDHSRSVFGVEVDRESLVSSLA
jgi:hypothetical protein